MKNIGVIVTICIAVIGGSVAYGKFESKAENTQESVKEIKSQVKDEVEKIEKKIEKSVEEIDEIENFSLRQSMILERVVQQLDRIEMK